MKHKLPPLPRRWLGSYIFIWSSLESGMKMKNFLQDGERCVGSHRKYVCVCSQTVIVMRCLWKILYVVCSVGHRLKQTTDAVWLFPDLSNKLWLSDGVKHQANQHRLHKPPHVRVTAYTVICRGSILCSFSPAMISIGSVSHINKPLLNSAFALRGLCPRSNMSPLQRATYWSTWRWPWNTFSRV